MEAKAPESTIMWENLDESRLSEVSLTIARHDRLQKPREVEFILGLGITGIALVFTVGRASSGCQV